METSTTLVEVTVLLIVVAIMAVTAWLFERFPLHRWSERRLPWLFPEGMVRNMEAIACARPYNYLGMMFFMMMGIIAVFDDLGISALGPILRYGVAVLVAVYGLHTSRRSAAQRAA